MTSWASPGHRSADERLTLVAGAALSFHGVQKVFGWMAQGRTFTVGSQLWVGGLIELVCGTLIALGLFARPAAFLASGTMAVAYVQFHWKLSLAGGMWLPSMNKEELALIYCFLFLFIATHGAGPISLDARLGRDRS